MYNKEYNDVVIKYASIHPEAIPDWKGFKFEKYHPKGYTIFHDTHGLAGPLSDYLQEFGNHDFDEESLQHLINSHGPFSISKDGTKIRPIRPVYSEIYHTNDPITLDRFHDNPGNESLHNDILTHLVESYHDPISLPYSPETEHFPHYNSGNYTTELPNHTHNFKVYGEHYLADLGKHHLHIYHKDYIPENTHNKLKEIEYDREHHHDEP